MGKKYGFRLKWLSVTSFEFRFGDTSVVSDPFITECEGTDMTWENVEKCDFITLSHTHWDHVTDIPRLCRKFTPKILCGDKAALPLLDWLNYYPSLIYPMYPDNELDFGDVKIRALYGRHINQKRTPTEIEELVGSRPVCQADPKLKGLQLLGSFDYRNYLFTLPNGTKILIWGSGITTEQVNLCKALAPDIAIIQRSVKPEQAAEKAKFAADIGAKVVIPHHHDFHGVDDPAIIENFKREFLKLVPDGTFLTPKHGEWLEL